MIVLKYATDLRNFGKKLNFLYHLSKYYRNSAHGWNSSYHFNVRYRNLAEANFSSVLNGSSFSGTLLKFSWKLNFLYHLNDRSRVQELRNLANSWISSIIIEKVKFSRNPWIISWYEAKFPHFNDRLQKFFFSLLPCIVTLAANISFPSFCFLCCWPWQQAKKHPVCGSL